MDSANLFHLKGADLIIITLIVALLLCARKMGDLSRHLGEELQRWQGNSREYPAPPTGLKSVNLWISLLTLFILLLACGLWVFGPME